MMQKTFTFDFEHIDAQKALCFFLFFFNLLQMLIFKLVFRS